MSIGSMFVLDDDGYTECRFIRGKRNVYPHARIYFRPATPSVRAEFADATRIEGGSEVAKQSNIAFNNALASLIVKWEPLDDNGDVIKKLVDAQGREHDVPPMNGEHLGKLRSAYHDRLVDIVWNGTDAGDDDKWLRKSNQQPGTPKERLEAKQKN